ncbi:MAG: hypothetical protein Q8R06_02660 [Polaromonas sp.]|uniref:hypothetical protein n=1 Tax=Polaromonas sp. TaxID=1869339 RepID=UPI002733B188|nr:hypothetical protein [Polaromonas sp.]MDP3796036.1 hypothetical protein [Polaromonas sp.]
MTLPSRSISSRAGWPRGGAYAKNCRELVDGLAGLGLRSVLPAAIQAPIIVTFHAPTSPAYEFKAFYSAVKQRDYIFTPAS